MQVMKNVGLVAMLLAVMMNGVAAIRWTGYAGNSFWNEPLNWEHSVLPGTTDEVILDNSYVTGSYEVMLPDFAVTVGRIRIGAAGGAEIRLVIPVTNMIAGATGMPDARALVLTENGYALELEQGGVFINASGAGSGYSCRFTDSILVHDGGKYIHRTRTGHAELVERLSRRPGTEKGVFRFENTDAASVISLSGRVFGRLELSAQYAPGQQVSYTAAGTSDALIRSDLIVEEGVRLAFNFSDKINVLGQLVARGSTLNLASAARSLTLAVGGGLHCENSLIEAVNEHAATGVLLLNGDKPQPVFIDQQLGTAIRLVLDNAAGFSAAGDISVQHEIHLKNGALRMDEGSRLLLGPSAAIVSDSLNPNSYVDGIVAKTNWNGHPLRFPVGKSRQRWLLLTGSHAGVADVEVAYHPLSAASLAAQLAGSIDHVSEKEYWTMRLSQPVPLQASLSFEHGVSGTLTDLASLRVAHLSGNTWADGGNLEITGTLLYGAVTGAFTMSGTASALALAGSLPGENILPIHLLQQEMISRGGRWYCRFRVLDIGPRDLAFLEWSLDGNRYEIMHTIPLQANQSLYEQELLPLRTKGFCRIVLTDAEGSRITGKPMRYGDATGYAGVDISRLGDQALVVASNVEGPCMVQVFDGCGRLLWTRRVILQKGANHIPADQRRHPPGVYVVTISDQFKWQVSRQLFLR